MSKDLIPRKLKTVIEAELEVLTPLHISSGEILVPADIVSDEDYFVRIDAEKLIETYADDEKALHELESARFSLQKFFEDRQLYVDDFMLYQLEARTRRSVRYDSPLHAFARKGANYTPYIPGSSVKGAFLSGLLWAFNQQARTDDDKWTSKRLEKALRKSMPKLDPFVNDSRLLNLILSKESAFFAQHPFRVIDAPFKNEDLGVFATALFNCDKPDGSGYHWKSFRKKATTDFKQIDFSLIEAVKPGAVIPIKIIVDEFALKQRKFGEVAKRFVQDETLNFSALASAMFELAYNTLWFEKEFFEKTGHRKLFNVALDLCNLASEIAENPESSEIIFRFGWGINYHGLTGFLWGEDIVRELKLAKVNYKDFPFPKSRHIVFDGQKEVGTPGWVKMRIKT